MDTVMDCLLLHVPKFRHRYGPFGPAMFINSMAAGLFSIASEVGKSGYGVEILHLGVERIVDPGFDLSAHLLGRRPKVVGLSLNWHHQAPDTMDTARIVRDTLPDAFVVLGGHTASCFAREILEDYPHVDAVIKGEGEVPMVRLVEALAGGSNLGAVPNLWWREDGEVVENDGRWCAGCDELTSFSFADFSPLSNAAQYPHLFPFMFPPERRYLNRLLFDMKSTAAFSLPLGRGCMNTCAWCGGGAHATRKLYGRRKIDCIAPEAAVEHMERAMRFGYTGVATDFNGPGVEKVVLEILALCRRRGFSPRWAMDTWTLPSRDFVDEFAATAAPGSSLLFSPDFAVEQLRERYKGYHFSNSSLFATLDYLDKREVPVGLHFIYGLPGAEQHDRESRAIIERIYRYRCVHRVQQHACELDPMSPLFLQPERYGIVPAVRTFGDYLNAHRGDFLMGFGHPGRTEKEIHDKRCDSVCLLGRYGKQKCAMSRAVTSMPALDILLYAAGKTLWGLRYDSKMSGLFSPGAK